MSVNNNNSDNNGDNNGDDNGDNAANARLLKQLSTVPAVREVDLSGCHLTSLPVELLAAKATLEKLNLGDNDLSDFPSTLCEFARLRILFCLNNRFTAVPSVVGRLPALSMLSFKSNALEHIPDDSLPSTLGWLILTDNRLRRLPDSLGRLKGLRKLMLASNQLATLPATMGQLHALELVRLSDNRLAEDELRKLAALPRLAWIAFGGQHQQLRPPPNAQACPNIAFEELTLGAVIGTGASGTVHRAQWRQQPVAVKLFKPASSDGRPVDEVAVASGIPDHTHIIRVLATFSSPSLGMVMELLSEDMRILGRTPSFDSVTRDVYDASQTLSAVAGVRILLGVAEAAKHLHEHGVMHGDLYAHNTLVALDGRVALGDFGAAFVYDRGAAPLPLEQIEARAFGCMVEEVAMLIERLTSTDPAVLPLKALAADCLQPVVTSRPTFHAIQLRLRALL